MSPPLAASLPHVARAGNVVHKISWGAGPATTESLFNGFWTESGTSTVFL